MTTRDPAQRVSLGGGRRNSGILAPLLPLLLVVALLFGPPARGGETAPGSSLAETALAWQQAFNAWERRHGAHGRIVAPVDRGAHEGVRYLEVEIERPLRRGVVDVCGWFAISERRLDDALEQIVGGGREACSDLRGAA